MRARRVCGACGKSPADLGGSVGGARIIVVRSFSPAARRGQGLYLEIDMHVFGGRETHVWAVIDSAGKNILSGKELSRAAAVLAAMKAIQWLRQRPRYE
jgi:hypothetical protein